MLYCNIGDHDPACDATSVNGTPWERAERFENRLSTRSRPWWARQNPKRAGNEGSIPTSAADPPSVFGGAASSTIRLQLEASHATDRRRNRPPLPAGRGRRIRLRLSRRRSPQHL